MAQDSSQEKTEQPTPKRLRDARKKGQVFKSKDMETVMVLIATFAAIAFSRSFMSSQFRELMEAAFQLAAQADPKIEEIYEIGKLAFLTVIKVSAPVLLTAMLTAGSPVTSGSGATSTTTCP